jgi:hypothetical protein
MASGESGLLFELTPRDTMTLVRAEGLLTMIGLLATS